MCSSHRVCLEYVGLASGLAITVGSVVMGFIPIYGKTCAVYNNFTVVENPLFEELPKFLQEHVLYSLLFIVLPEAMFPLLPTAIAISTRRNPRMLHIAREFVACGFAASFLNRIMAFVFVPCTLIPATLALRLMWGVGEIVAFSIFLCIELRVERAATDETPVAVEVVRL